MNQGLPGLPISAVIVAKNAEKTLDACLESVSRNNPAEIIVIDGLSTDRTVEIARKYTDRIYSDEGRGVSFAHQLALEKGRQPFISFIDADIVLPAGALARMLEELETGNLANIQATIRPRSVETYWERAQDEHVRSRQSRVPGGLSACVMDRAAALKIGFDPAIYIAGDDMDFLYRLNKMGYRAGLSAVKADHEHRTDFKALMRQKFWYGRAKPALIRKHGPWKGELWAPAVMAYWLVLSVGKGKLNLIPYVIASGIAETAGMVKGVFELRARAD
jgi:glycosyltransferase involved in cell wall biosynthesis